MSDDLSAVLTRLEAGTTGLQKTTIVRVRADVMDRIDPLQDVVAAQRDDVFVTFHTQDRTDRLAEASHYMVASTLAQIDIQHRISPIQANIRVLKGEP